MPELPEVEVTRRQISRVLVGRTVSAVETTRASYFFLTKPNELNARLLGFNVDPQFGDALDALMMVDLTQVDAAILARYLGREGARQFLAHHTAPPAAA